MKTIHLIPAILNLFDANVQVSTQSSLSDEMRTYYSDYLIDNAEPRLVHDQFGQKKDIPKTAARPSISENSASCPRRSPPHRGRYPRWPEPHCHRHREHCQAVRRVCDHV